MAASEAFHGFGSTLKIGQGETGSPETFVAVAEVASIKMGAMTTSQIDVTHLNSDDTHRERKPGIKDTAAFTMSGNYLPADATQKNAARGLLALWKNRTVFNAKVCLSDDDLTEWPFSGFISNFEVGEIGVDGHVPFTCEITPRTQVTTLP